MIVDDLNLIRFAVGPDEANPPLVIDPHAVLTGSISLERLQAIARWDAKVLQPPSRVKVQQFAPTYTLDGLKPPGAPILEQIFSIAASKRSDQDLLYDVPGIPSISMGGNLLHRQPRHKQSIRRHIFPVRNKSTLHLPAMPPQ